MVEAIGWALGVPGDYCCYTPGSSLGWCDFLGGIFCGGGGGSSGSTGGGSGGGTYYSIIYSGYIPGYEGYNGVNSGWVQFPDSDPCIGMNNASKIKVNQQEGGCPIIGGPINAFADYYELPANRRAWLAQHPEVYSALNIYIDSKSISFEEGQEYVQFNVTYLMNHPGVTIDALVDKNYSVFDPSNTDWSTEPDNQTLFDPNPVSYAEYQQSTTWPTVSSVIPYHQFVPHRKVNNIDVNCLTLAREQLAKVGYDASGYLPGTQTFQTYTSSGPNASVAKQAITYMITALADKIPVIVGVDAINGSRNYDGLTDHFIVIDGMGSDANGKYFHFIDNSTSDPWAGNSKNNRIYYNGTTGELTGHTDSKYPYNIGGHDYIITQVRKSIKN